MEGRGRGGAEPSGPPLGTLVGLNQQAGLGCQSLVLLDVVLLKRSEILWVIFRYFWRQLSEQLVCGGRRKMRRTQSSWFGEGGGR